MTGTPHLTATRARTGEATRTPASPSPTSWTCNAGRAELSVRDGEDGERSVILPRTRLQPDTGHRFVLPEPVRSTHVRIDIFPDGGISRLRLFGSLTEEGAARLTARHEALGG